MPADFSFTIPTWRRPTRKGCCCRLWASCRGDVRQVLRAFIRAMIDSSA